MTVNNPAFNVPRQSVVGMEGMWCKMWDPPTESPATPDKLLPTNPVPEVMAAAGFQSTPSTPHTVERDLMHGDQIPTWDGLKRILFYLIRDANNPVATGTYPGPIIRIPRGVVFHGHTQGHGPPPHTIHWHGIEPTPMNDGVGHCSMEIGDYTYQWQPNFIGFYFYHCHRNTVQHFEFGLYSLLMVEPPDAYFATQWNPAIPIGHCRDGKRRIAAGLDTIKDAAGNLVANPFPGFNNNPVDAPDPEAGSLALPDYLKFPVDPHAMTVPYDIEVIWGPDDRDSRWSDLAPDARATYPRHGDIPGVNDQFHRNPGQNGFFAFNDFRPDYFYVTGVPVSAHVGGVGTLPVGAAVPAGLNSGVAGTQVSVQAEVGQTILVRCINGAYVNATYRFPVDVICIAWDGRSLGIPPYTQYNHPYLILANTPIPVSVARRCDFLVKVDSEFHGFAEIDFVDTRGMVPDTPGYNNVVLMTARIPFDIGPVAPVADVFSVSGATSDADNAPIAGASVTVSPHSLGGSPTQTVLTDAEGNFTVTGLRNGMYQVAPFKAGLDFTPVQFDITVNGANITIPDFVGAAATATYAIMGRVRNAAGDPIEGVTITATDGTVTASAVTDALGDFSVEGLVNGNYVVTAADASIIFTPASRDALIINEDAKSQNFVGTAAPTFAISGTVTNLGAPLAGVAIAVTGPTTGSAVTDAAGNYSIAGLFDGSYIVTPSLAGFTFTPPSINTVVAGANVTSQNFAAAAIIVPKYNVSGTIVDAVGDPMAGVSIAVTGAAAASATTNAAGAYNFALADGSYILTPSLAGFTFNPPGINVVVAGADITASQNFAAAQTSVGNVTVTKVSVKGGTAKKAPTWTITGTGTPGATITIVLGPDLIGEELGTTVVNRRGSWTFKERVAVQTPVEDWTSISVSSSDGSITANTSLIVVTKASVNTRGKAALTKGPSWSISGKSAPGTTVSVFLGPDLTGELVGTDDVSRSGKWKLSGRIPVTTTPIPASISISSSTGGSSLDIPLTVK